MRRKFCGKDGGHLVSLRELGLLLASENGHGELGHRVEVLGEVDDAANASVRRPNQGHFARLALTSSRSSREEARAC